MIKASSVWASLLEEYFSEVKSDFLDPTQSASFLQADLMMVEPSQLTSALVQKIRGAKSVNPNIRVFGLGASSREFADVYDVVFDEACGLFDFSKKISEKLITPLIINLLVADDDPDILAMVCDYFEGRQNPSFNVRRATNGREAWELIEKKRPDAIILDMKMPIMKGSAVYAKLQKLKDKIPTIIFYDAISAGDLDLVKKSGKPVIVEKGYRESSLPYLMALVKKLVYFAG